MNILKKNTRIFAVNLLSDYILNQIPSGEKSIINVIDVRNFIIVKGITSYNEVLELQKIINTFKEEFTESLPEDMIFNSIDLIEYGKEMTEVCEIESILYNTSNCSYSEDQIFNFKKNNFSYSLGNMLTQINENDLNFVSSFPFGHSLDQGRFLFYLSKKIAYDYFKTIKSNNIKISISNDIIKINDEIQKINIEKIKQDLNSEFKNIKKSTFDELFNPIDDLYFLK